MSDVESCLAFLSQSASISALVYTWAGARDGHRQNGLQHMRSPLVKWDDTTKRFTVGQEDKLIGKGNVRVVTKVCRVLFLQPTRIPYRSNGLRALGDTLAEGKASCSWAAGQGGWLLLSHGYPHGIQALAAASDHPLNRREAGKQTNTDIHI